MISPLKDLCSFNILINEKQNEFVKIMGKSSEYIHCFGIPFFARKITIKKACYLVFKNGYTNLIEIIIRDKLVSLDLIMLWATEFGYLKFVKFAHEQGAENNKECFYQAILSEKNDAIEYHMQFANTPTKDICNWAYRCKNIEDSKKFTDFLINYRLKFSQLNYVQDIIYPFLEKCIKNHHNQLLIIFYENFYDKNYLIRNLTCFAMIFNNVYFLKLVHKDTSDILVRNNIYESFLKCVHVGNYEVIVYVLENITDDFNINFLIQLVGKGMRFSRSYDKRILPYLESLIL